MQLVWELITLISLRFSTRCCSPSVPPLPLKHQVPGVCGSFTHFCVLISEFVEHFAKQNKDFIFMYYSRKVRHTRGVEAPGSKSQFFQLLLKDTSTVSDTLIAVKMKCVISKSQDALSSAQITLLSQMDTSVSFIVFISLRRGSSLTSLLEDRFSL